VKGFGNMMKEAQKLQEKMLAMQEEIAKRKVDATAGGGMVTVEANGKQEVLAACNEALRKSRELVQQELGKLTGGMKLPGLGL
jgi:DNA-binding protein YbaB